MLLGVIGVGIIPAGAEEYVTEAKSVTYSCRWGNRNQYYGTISYSKPQLNLNSADAAQINREIDEFCDPAFRDVELYKNTNSLPELVNSYMSYRWAYSKNIVSIIIDYKLNVNQIHRYYVASINVSTGRRMSYSEVASYFGTDMNNIKKAASALIKSRLNQLYRSDYYDRVCQRSLSSANLNDIKVFLDQSGNLRVIYRVYQTVGPESLLYEGYAYVTAAPKVSVTANNSGIQIKWNKIGGVPKYRVYKKVNGSWSKLGDTTNLSFTDQNAKAGNACTYTVRGIPSDGSRFMTNYQKNGATLQFTAKPSIQKLEPVANGIKLSWNKPSGTVRYRLFVKRDGSWKQVADTNAQSYTFTGVTSGQTYTFTLRTINQNATAYTSGYNTTGWSRKFVAVPQISSLSCAANGVVIKWNKPSGAENFRVYRKTGTGSWTKIATTASTSFTDTAARQGVSYTYTVRCVSKDDKSFTSYFNEAGKSITYRKP